MIRAPQNPLPKVAQDILRAAAASDKAERAAKIDAAIADVKRLFPDYFKKES